MEKKLVFQITIFKFISSETDKYSTTYQFRICDLNTKEELTKTETKLEHYKKFKEGSESNYEFNNTAFWRGRKDRIHFRVKDKWLEHKDFDEKQYYQGNLELNFYSMEKKDYFSKGCVIAPKTTQEGYFAKLSNVQLFQPNSDED